MKKILFRRIISEFISKLGKLGVFLNYKVRTYIVLYFVLCESNQSFTSLNFPQYCNLIRCAGAKSQFTITDLLHVCSSLVLCLRVFDL